MEATKTANNDALKDNNRVHLIGEIKTNPEFNHEVYGEGFYLMTLAVKRQSETIDTIPLMVSDRLINVNEDLIGCIVEVKGQFRSYNKHEETKNRLILSVFTTEFRFLGEDETYEDINRITLDGFICKEPVYRTTPLGREICDMLIAVNRPYGKSDYIPAICWGRNAKFASGLNVGEHVSITGRIQSRIYQKKIDETHTENKTAYEVSLSKIEQLD
jgi:single-stranded DNA-binding protein